MRFDLCKTQFLLGPGEGGHPIRAFKRKRTSVLFSGQGLPMRPITTKEWRDLVRDYPVEVKADGLTVRNVWVLTEVKPR